LEYHFFIPPPSHFSTYLFSFFNSSSFISLYSLAIFFSIHFSFFITNLFSEPTFYILFSIFKPYDSIPTRAMWVFCHPVRVIFISYLLLIFILLYFFIGQNSNTLFISQQKYFTNSIISSAPSGPVRVIWTLKFTLHIHSYFFFPFSFTIFSFFSLFFYTYPPLDSLFISNISYHFFLFNSLFFFFFFIFLYT